MATNIREVLAQAGARKLKLRDGWLMKKRQLIRKLPLCIEAISVTCGGRLLPQLRPFVEQVKFLHPEWPLHIATDPEGRARIQDLLGPEDVVWTLLEKDHVRHSSGKSIDHGQRWSKSWIGLKLENFQRALKHFQCGVLQCDSDFIFCRSLPKTNWHADVVMSTHRGPLMHNNVPDFHGRYNAGLLLTDDLAIADKWRELYEAGVGEFYEQKLLEQFDDLYVVDLFPSDWNWGAWRNQEDVKYSLRVPAFFHTHITGPHTQATPLHDAANNRYFMLKHSYGTHPRIAFYHASKAAGSEMMEIIHKQVAAKVQYQVLNSRAIRSTDWTEAELKDIAVERFKYQHGNRFIVHNHGQNWSEQSVDLFKYFDWKFLGLYRPIQDRMASFYYWNLDAINKHGRSWMQGHIAQARTITDFFEAMLTEPYLQEWTLPSYYQDIKWYAATSAGMAQLALDNFNLSISQPRRMNASNNLGWAHCVQLLSPGLLARLQVEFVKWDRIEQEGLLNL